MFLQGTQVIRLTTGDMDWCYSQVKKSQSLSTQRIHTKTISMYLVCCVLCCIQAGGYPAQVAIIDVMENTLSASMMFSVYLDYCDVFRYEDIIHR